MTANPSTDLFTGWLKNCSPEEREHVFTELRKTIRLHVLEEEFGAPAEAILDAIKAAPELTQRMLKGVIADFCFGRLVVPELKQYGWTAEKLEGNHSYDHKLTDSDGPVTIQVKLQRSAKGKPYVSNGRQHGLTADMFMCEVWRTRTGKKKKKNSKASQKAESTALDNETGSADDADQPKIQDSRPYDFNAFDILAVSLRPSTNRWEDFRYTVAAWLAPEIAGSNLIFKYQPVPRIPNCDWTDDFNEVVRWLRSGKKKTIAGRLPPKPPRQAMPAKPRVRKGRKASIPSDAVPLA
jgi:hypothetical protein